MLNEIKEFEEICDTTRFKEQVTKNDFSGLKRALEILSIAYLHESSKEENDAIEYTKEKLKGWVEEQYTTHVRKILKKMGAETETLSSETVKKNNTISLKQFEKRKKDFDSTVLYSVKDNKDRRTDTRSNINQLSYERAIANALVKRGYEGLKRYYLVCDDDLLNVEQEHIQVTNKKRARTNAYGTVIDVVSKITAAYLLKQKEVNDSSELRLTQVDIFNWIVKGNENQYFDNNTYYMLPEKVKIFEKIGVGNKAQNTVKYYCNPKWISHFDVIEESELEEWLKENKDKPNHHFYSDWGSKEPLKEDKRYRKLSCKMEPYTKQ